MAFKEWEINPQITFKGGTMKGNEISVLYQPATKQKSSAYVLTINGFLTDKAYLAGFSRLSFSQDDITGSVAMLLRKEGGLPLRLKGRATTASKTGNFVISCKPLLERIYREFKLEHGKRYFLRLSENMSRRDDVMFFLITEPTDL